MRARIRKKYFSIMMVFVLMVSMLTPAAGPLGNDALAADGTLTVGEAIEQDNDGSEQTVRGHVVGYVLSSDNVSQTDFNDDYNVALADEADETDPDQMLYVQVTDDFRSEFGLKTNPDNLGEEIVVTGTLNEYHSHNGLKEPNDMRFASEEPEEPDDPLEIQTIAEVRDQATGEAKTKGVVTAKLNNTIQIQDDTAAIAVRPTSLDVQMGDEITVIGSLDDYRGLLQLNNATIGDKAEGSVIPDPLSITGGELENHQSKLAVIENVTLTDVHDAGDWANYTAEDDAGNTFVVRDETGELTLKTDVTYDAITGVVTQFDSDQQIIPRSQSDIVGDTSAVQPVTASPEPGVIPTGTDVTLETATDGADILYTTDGSDPSENGERYAGAITVDEDVTIKAIAEKEGLTTNETAEFSYSVYDSENGVMIHDIQGKSHASPMDGSTVQDVEGIVTYEYEIRDSNYFHMQTPEEDYDGNEKTSEGIVVYTGNSNDVEVGDLVSVTGEVDEYHIDGYEDRAETDLSVTELVALDDQGGVVDVMENDVNLPSAVEITSSDIPEEIVGEDGFDSFEPANYAIDYWESIEGMRVEVAPSRAVAPQEHGDLVVATEEFMPENSTENGGIRLTDEGPNAQTIQFKLHPNGDARDFAVKTGDKFTETVDGVVNYGYGNYKVYADLEDAESVFEEGDTKPEQTSIVKDEDKLTVATYNVENFSANDRETSPQKAESIARAFVSDMNIPDIVGIVEVQDNNGQDEGPQDADASESYQRLIDEIKNQGGPDYDYANIDPAYNQDGGAPHGNIRVGFLYNPERVSLMDGDAGTSTEATDYVDEQLTLNPGRISPNADALEDTRKPLAAQFNFNGESVVVVANHFNSKSGDDGAFGQNQPPELKSEPQRRELAKIVHEFVTDIKADNPDENVMVLGDMNDFEFSEPLDILEGEELTNKIMSVPEDERYTYVYQGNSQVLDHVLVSDHLAEATEVDILHVNSDFTDMHGRASDHDPIMTQIDLQDTEESDTPFDFSIMHMNDTHAHVESLPKMITAIKDFRKENPDSLLLHGGDVFSGTLYFNEFNGQADLELLNMMEMDAMVFGNHEFDLGGTEGGHESLSKFVENAAFPFLGTNIDFSQDPHMKELETNQPLVDSPENGQIYNSIVKNIEGEQVGIFGLTTEDTENIANPEDVTFADYKETTEQTVQAFEDAGIDKIVALNHLGFDSAPEVGNDLRLAEEVDGIDVIVGGHSHSELDEPEIVPQEQASSQVVMQDEEGDAKAPTVIVQAGQYAEHLGTLDVTFDDNGVVTAYEGELLDVGEYAEDPEAAEVLKPYKEAIFDKMTEEIGAVAKQELTNPRQDEPGDDSVRANETELGNLITDAMLAKAQEKYPETVIAFQNGGGIRAPIDEGPITTGEVMSVLPFGNNPVIATLTGQEIKDILEHSVRQAPAENGGFLHVSGMRFYYDSEKEPGSRIVQMYVQNDGEWVEMQPDKEYHVTTNGFTGQGGDGFETFAQAYDEGRVKDIGESDWGQLVEYMVEEEYLDGIVDPEREGRIVDLKGEDFTGLPNNPEDPGENEDPGDDNGNNGSGDDSGSNQDGMLPGEDDDPSGHGMIPGDRSGDGATLPDTATNMFTFLLIGSMLLAAGGMILLYRRRHFGNTSDET
ncbi:LPXTG-motif cell wall anchor domain-containing protein [Lentibacillus halodurans]|uniref:LPXTG-motif cell wall anchor domain-containing protein n=1 Tax=Lentibacillus halodurans TaxID=237679 RepID=A0A1I0YCS5_9BACI|nr:5'-nucleotidase C-terminal domain-containing protein [Lentibacillus halodurans]SFB11195.1 LPXTG-motif cell wall anchor domain-containing protein [Lentibacillus halodurans]